MNDQNSSFSIFEIFEKNVKKINIKVKFENIEILKNIKNYIEK